MSRRSFYSVLDNEDDPPSDEELRKFDKTRKNKKVSNDEWESPTDPDSRIARMKDGTTHLAYKAEHVIDLEMGLLVAADIYHANEHDTATLEDSLHLTSIANQSGRGGQHRGDSGCRGRCRLSRRRDVIEHARAHALSHVQPRAAATASFEVERQTAGVSGSRRSESPPHARRSRTPFAAAAKRAG